MPMVRGRPSTTDAYIAGTAAFAEPILTHLAALIRKACPECEEAIKWGRPFFLYRGALVCNIVAFKAHCSFGFWGEEMGAVLCADGIDSEGSSGSFGRIVHLRDLPSDRAIVGYVRQAMSLIDAGSVTSKQVRIAKTKPRVPKTAGKPLPVPAELSAALAKNKKATAKFEALSPSHRREYVEWISEAKRDATRQTRVTTAITWLSEGKSRNWKYER